MQKTFGKFQRAIATFQAKLKRWFELRKPAENRLEYLIDMQDN
jgi:hypothetical protein